MVEPIYPNPVYNQATITFVLLRAVAAGFEVFDVAGRRVLIR